MRPFLQFHNESKKTGFMPHVSNGADYSVSGLCDEYSKHPTFDLFKPSYEELKAMGYNDISIDYECCFWASGDPKSDHSNAYTKLRETIVLFCAVIDGEI